MSYESPTPPADLPTDIVNTLNSYSPDQLQHMARYTKQLAEHKAREARLKEESEEDKIDERPDDLPDDVPAKATVTIKEIMTTATTIGSGGKERKSGVSTRPQ